MKRLSTFDIDPFLGTRYNSSSPGLYSNPTGSIYAATAKAVLWGRFYNSIATTHNWSIPAEMKMAIQLNRFIAPVPIIRPFSPSGWNF